jgi:hypothetical protein
MSQLRDFLKQLVNVQVVLGGVEYPNTYGDDISIDRTDLQEEFVRHAERYAYYATLAELADDRADRLKEDLEHLAAKLDHDTRQKAVALKQADPSFKMTETMVENEVKMHAAYRQAQTEYQEARHLAKLLKNAPHAFAHRRDMLIELGKTSMSTVGSPTVNRGLMQQARQVIERGVAPQMPPATINPPLPAHLTEEQSLAATEPAVEPAPVVTSRRRPARSAA